MYGLNDSGTKQVCGVLNGTTVCLTDMREAPTTCYNNYENCELTSTYAIQKKEEMEAINGVTCNVAMNLQCTDGTYKCVIGNQGQVSCSTASFEGASAGQCYLSTDPENPMSMCMFFN